MPRFVPSRYNIRTESSPHTDSHQNSLKAVVLVVDEDRCPCGCNQPTDSPKTRFRMGHDARYRGKLIRAHRTGTKVALLESHSSNARLYTAFDLAVSEGWASYLTRYNGTQGGDSVTGPAIAGGTSAGDAITPPSDPPITEAEVIEAYEGAIEEPEPAPVRTRIKMGRWFYDAIVTPDGCATYTSKSGDTLTAAAGTWKEAEEVPAS